MTAQWEGCRVSNRLNLWYDDDMHHSWVISGRDESVYATGGPAEMVRLAVSILENLPDSPENGPPLGLNEEREALPPEAGELITRAVELATNPPPQLDEEARQRLAGGLMAVAVAVHLLRQGPQEVWSVCRTPRFAFRMEIDAQPLWDEVPANR